MCFQNNTDDRRCFDALTERVLRALFESLGQVAILSQAGKLS